MKEVSNRFVVILVIIALVISLVGTYLVTKNIIESNGDNQPGFSTEPHSTGASVTLTVIDEIEGENNGT